MLENKAARDWKESFSAQGLRAPEQLIYSLYYKVWAIVAAVISAGDLQPMDLPLLCSQPAYSSSLRSQHVPAESIAHRAGGYLEAAPQPYQFM